MENNLIDPQNTVNQLHAFAANMLVNQDKNSYEVKKALIEKGVDEESAAIIVENVEIQIEEARKSRANKDLLYGALWLFGGDSCNCFYVFCCFRRRKVCGSMGSNFVWSNTICKGAN